MGMSKEVKVQFKEDNTYVELKTRNDDNSVSTTEGEWQLDKEGAILTMVSKGKSMPSKIVDFKNDTLVVEMRGSMNLVMVKE